MRGFLKEQRAILLNGDGDGLGGGIHLLGFVLGSSIGTPIVISGAATMKTMSSTSMTSTSGVTFDLADDAAPAPGAWSCAADSHPPIRLPKHPSLYPLIQFAAR